MTPGDVVWTWSAGDALLARHWKGALALLFALGLMVGVSNALSPWPLETHEVFVAQTSREMLEAGDWVLPMFNAEPRLNKPPLAYWLVMGLERAWPDAPGIEPWKARLPSGIAGALLVVMTALIGRAAYGSALVGFVGAMLVCGSSGLMRYSNNARPEMLYAACCTLVILGLLRAWQSPDRSRAQSMWALTAWGAAGLGVLAKGPHLPMVIVAGFVLHAVLSGSWRRLWWTLRAHWGVVAMLAIGVPWVVLVWQRAPQAGGVWFDQISDAPDRGELSWLELFAPYYLWGLPQMFLPWAALLPFGLASVFVGKSGVTQRGRPLFWVLIAVVVALSVTTHRRGYYTLPVLSILGALCAAGTLDAIARLREPWCRRWGRAFVGAAVAGVFALAWVGTRRWAAGEGGIAKDAFARAVAARVGDDAVYLWGERAGLVTYRVGRPTPELATAEEVLSRASPRGAWLVTRPDRLKELEAMGGVEPSGIVQDTGEAREARVLVRLVPRVTP